MGEVAASNEKPFVEEVRELINRKSLENLSNTPDFILAQFLADALSSYERTVKARDKWFGYRPEIGGGV